MNLTQYFITVATERWDCYIADNEIAEAVEWYESTFDQGWECIHDWLDENISDILNVSDDLFRSAIIRSISMPELWCEVSEYTRDQRDEYRRNELVRAAVESAEAQARCRIQTADE